MRTISSKLFRKKGNTIVADAKKILPQVCRMYAGCPWQLVVPAIDLATGIRVHGQVMHGMVVEGKTAIRFVCTHVSINKLNRRIEKWLFVVHPEDREKSCGIEAAEVNNWEFGR